MLSSTSPSGSKFNVVPSASKPSKNLRFEDDVDSKPALSRAPGGPSSASLSRRRSSLPALRPLSTFKPSNRVQDDSSTFLSRMGTSRSPSEAFASTSTHQATPWANTFSERSRSFSHPDQLLSRASDHEFGRTNYNDDVVPQRRRSSASSTASVAALASAATYSQNEIYGFLLVSKETTTAAEFICQLLQLGGLNDEILISEFKTILIDLMAERFSEMWDIRAPKKGASFRAIQHSPNPSNNHADPTLQTAFVLCNIHPKHLSTLLPVSFSLTINPGLVSYTTNDVGNFQPVHLFEARPYLPPKHQEPVDHGAEIRMRALKHVELGNIDVEQFDVDSYFGGRSNVPARRPSLANN